MCPFIYMAIQSVSHAASQLVVSVAMMNKNMIYCSLTIRAALMAFRARLKPISEWSLFSFNWSLPSSYKYNDVIFQSLRLIIRPICICLLYSIKSSLSSFCLLFFSCCCILFLVRRSVAACRLLYAYHGRR